MDANVVAILSANASRFTKGFKEAENAVTSLQRSTSKNMKAVGDTISGIGKGLTVGITVPLAAVGIASVKTAVEFDSQMRRVKAIAGATESEFEALKAQAMDLGEKTVFSAKETAIGFEEMASAGFTVTEIMSSMPGVLDLAAVSGKDVGLASEAAATAIRQFGLDASHTTHVADVFARAAADTNAETVDMAEALKYAGPIAAGLGMTIEETAAAIGVMSDAGIKGSQAGTTLRGALTNLAKPTKAAQKVMNELGLEFFNAKGEMKPFGEIVGELNTKFAGLTQEQKQAALTTLFGKNAMSGMLSLIDQGPEKYNNLTKSLINSDGAAKDMAETMNSGLGGALEEMSGALETAAIVVGDALAPTISALAGKIQKLAQWFNNLNPSTQQTIVKFGALAMAAGPITWAVGGLISTFSKFTPVIGAVKTAFGLFSSATAVASGTALATTPVVSGLASVITALSGPIGIAIAAVAALGVGMFAFYKSMQKDAIPTVDLFGDSVSKATKEAVTGFVELEKEATNSLNQLAWSGAEVTGELKNNVTNNINSMKNEVVDALTQQKNESLSTMQEMVNRATEMSEEQKQMLIAKTQESYDGQILAVEEGNARINEIMNSASEEKRALTQAEADEINTIKQNMLDSGIQALTASEEEYAIIMQRMADQGAEISARGAAEVVQNSLKQKEQVIQTAEEEYNERIRVAEKIRAEGTAEASATADQIIQEAQRQRDETIASAGEMHDNVINHAKEQAKEHINEVNWETGEVKSKWEMLKSDLASAWDSIKTKSSQTWTKVKTDTVSKFNEIKTSVANSVDNLKTSIKNGFNNAKESISTSVNNMKSTISTGFQNMVSTISSKGKEIVSSVRTSFSNAISAAKGFARDAVSVGSNLISGFVSGVRSAAGRLVNAVKGAVGNAIQGAKNLLGIASPSRVFKQFGIYTDLGFIEGIEHHSRKVVKTMSNMMNDVISVYNNDDLDFSGKLSNLNSRVSKDITHKIADNNSSPQPLNFILELGNRAYKGFVEDIKNENDKTVHLEEIYGY